MTPEKWRTTAIGLGPLLQSTLTIYHPSSVRSTPTLVIWHYRMLQQLEELEGVFSQNMTTLSEYLQTWVLKLSHTKK